MNNMTFVDFGWWSQPGMSIHYHYHDDLFMQHMQAYIQQTLIKTTFFIFFKHK